MKSKFNLMHICMVISASGLLSSSDMESVLEVGRDNQLLSAKSQDNIDATAVSYTHLTLPTKA